MIKAMSTFLPNLYIPVCASATARRYLLTLDDLQLPKVAKAMRVVGEVGTQGIPPERLQQMGDKAKRWNLLDNANIIAIADSFN